MDNEKLGVTAENEESEKDIFDKIMSLPVLNIFEGFYKKNKSVLLYLFFGVLTTAVSFLAAFVGKEVLEAVGFGKDFVSTASTVFSWICAVTFAYITNRIWVFNSKAKGAGEIAKEAASFYGGRVFTLVVETLMMWLGYSLLQINYWITKIIANVVVLILNYVISKLFVFKKSD
ncbi:MAG: GtrA family protein [Ruminococcus sp.]|nr:GtrA family protein [Ruminococcus sp.]